jgi:hypothetical protein
VTALAWTARVVLAVALAFAAVQKLRHRARTRAQTVALLGPRAGPAVAVVLPFVELVIAVALLVWDSAVPGILGALLLAGFTVVVIRAELRHLPCPCFGSAGERPAGPAQILRNAVLLGCAVLATLPR